MSTDSDQTPDWRSITLHVPDHQWSQWQAEADELEMNRSEFVREMVQVGRRRWFSQNHVTADGDTDIVDDTNLEEQVIEVLTRSEYCDWQELVDALTDNIEARLEDALETLQSKNKIKYSGRQGGYTLAK